MTDWDSPIGRELYFIFLALVLAFGILQTSGTIMDTEQPVVSVVSCSMYPEYDRGDVMIVNGADFEDIQEDEVIVFDVPLKASISIDGENYNLSEDSIETSIGEARVTSVKDRKAVIEINGEPYQMTEGGTYSIEGLNVELTDVSGVDIPVVHRVIQKGDNSLETKGDNNPGQLEFEKDIRPEQVYGRVFFRIPKIGSLKLAAMDLFGLTGQPLQINSEYGCR